MTIGIWVLGDRLSQQQSALKKYETVKKDVAVILIESSNYARQRIYHRQKLVLIWSAMRHFAEELKQDGWQVTYAVAEDFFTSLQEWIEACQITELNLTEPSDRPFTEYVRSLDLNCQLNLLPDNHFLWTKAEFKAWAERGKRLLMEDFYREGRKRFNILMAGKKPLGGKWNFDKQNRQPPKQSLTTPDPITFEPDPITQEVIDWIENKKFSSYGKIEPFNWGVTRQQALEVLKYFIDRCLANFGAYQDAMITGEYTMWHSLISPYLNLGLLEPGEVISAVEAAYYRQDLPLNSVEGFIRQVLGWREYMNGIYHYMDANYGDRNWFEHHHPLPDFFWDANATEMNCLHQSLTQIEAMGYAHHIQRLMVLSNFALIAGISPQKIESWFHSAFIDGYDWVMQTNVIGMGQFADGGVLASKPYAASANYINKMSDYCTSCGYNRSDRTGDKACPFNFFYWDFLIRHRDRLQSLGRMNLVLSHLKRLSPEEIEQIQSRAKIWWQSQK